MAVKIRLTRIGRHKDPIYRIVAADHKYARDGRYIEQVGYYDPSKGIENATLEEEKVLKWLAEGAQYSDTIKAILSAKGLIKKSKEPKEGEKKEKNVKTGSGKKVSKKKLESKKAKAEAKKLKAENLKKVEERKALAAKKRAEEEAAQKAAEEAAAAAEASASETPAETENTTPNE